VTRFRATFHYRLRRLLAALDVLGKSIEVARDGATVVLTFPTTGEVVTVAASSAPEFDDRFPERDSHPMVEGGLAFASIIQRQAYEDPALVIFARVEVFLKDAYSAGDFARRVEDHEACAAIVERAADIADAMVADFVAWTRVHGKQTWLGLDLEAPDRVGTAELVDLDAELQLPLPAEIDFELHGVGPDAVLQAASLGVLRDWLEAQEAPDLADRLLADAGFLMQSEPPDPSRALLVAAIACEVKVKTTLREHASLAQRDLVDLLLDNPRDFSLAASSLFDTPLKTVVGASLTEVGTNKELWKRIDALFTRRNRLAHRGEIPSVEDVADGIAAAHETFEWIATQVA
jgi:hypothetical protein